MGRHYEVMYWGYNEDDGTAMTELRRAVTIPAQTMEKLRNGTKTHTYFFITDDGQEWILSAQLLCEVRELLAFD